MKMFKTIINTVKFIFVYTLAILLVIALLLLLPESRREQEVKAAKQRISDRLTNLEARQTEIERELEELKQAIAIPDESTASNEAIATSNEPTTSDEAIAREPQPGNQIPDPWNEAAPIVQQAQRVPAPQLHQWPLCLPPARIETEPKAQKKRKSNQPKLAENYRNLTLKQLKAIAADRQIKCSSTLKKADLIQLLMQQEVA